MRMIKPKKGSRKGVALIIIIFAMMVFAVLGWTLASMLSTDFEANMRSLDSERAFYLAEAGGQEAVELLNLGDAAFDADTDTLTRTLNYGQYYVTRTTNSQTGVISVYSTGYVPQITPPYRAKRQVKLDVTLGGLNQAVEAKGLLDWSASKLAGRTVDIDGDISALYYNGDGNATYNELNSDYGLNPLLPPGTGSYARDFDVSVFPLINMNTFYTLSGVVIWPDPSTKILTATISNSYQQGGHQYIEVSNSDGLHANFFTTGGVQGQDMTGEAIKLDGITNWYTDNNNWCYITKVSSGTKAQVDNVNSNFANFTIGKAIKFVKRYNNAPSAGVYYIGGAQGGGMPADLLIDVTSGNINFNNNVFVCEGNTIIKGTRTLQMTTNGKNSATGYLLLATKNGDIISTDAVGGSNKRIFSGQIYSEEGTVNFNYLTYPVGASTFISVYGNNVVFSGDISIKQYTGKKTFAKGSILAPSSISWSEQ